MLLNQILLDAQVVHNKALTIECICSHIECEQIVYRVILCKSYLIKADMLADKSGKLIRRNLSQTFKSGNLCLCTTLFNCIQTLLL